MWIMECKEHAQEFKMYNNHDRTKLRPLMPRPIDHCATKSISMSESSVLPLPHYWCLQNPSFPPWNQFPSPGNCVNDYGIKREMSAAPLVTSRWNPTPEQLQALEEMYRRGIRTPSAEQIQQIAAKLRRFGKIEGKNVFYWFQNHKARERQRKRRQDLESLAGKKMRHGQINLTTDQRPLGLSNRRRLEIEQAKKMPMPSNITALQYSINEELDNEELQQQSIAAAGESTETSCWQLDLSCCLSPNNSEDNVAAKKTPGQENSKPFAAFNLGKLLPAISTSDHFGNGDSGGIQGNFHHHHHQTLELFPMKGGNGLESHTSSGDEETNDVSSIVGMSKLGPNQYYEFLPMKDCY